MRNRRAGRVGSTGPARSIDPSATGSIQSGATSGRSSRTQRMTAAAVTCESKASSVDPAIKPAVQLLLERLPPALAFGDMEERTIDAPFRRRTDTPEEVGVRVALSKPFDERGRTSVPPGTAQRLPIAVREPDDKVDSDQHRSPMRPFARRRQQLRQIPADAFRTTNTPLVDIRHMHGALLCILAPIGGQEERHRVGVNEGFHGHASRRGRGDAPHLCHLRRQTVVR